jgi:outer membrane protein OmpA-like peptidoglycan-associated protein/TolA-binding protein
LSRSQSTLLVVPGLCVLVVLLGSGCAYFNTFYNAKAAYREGLKLKEQNQQASAKTKFDKAIEKSALVIKRWPKSRWVDDALFLVGASYYQQGYYAKAVRHFDQLALAFPNSGFVPEAELYRGLAELADKQYGTARVTLDAVEQKYPRFADEASFHLARSFVGRQELERATDSLAAFLERFPKSRFRREATRLLADATFKLERSAEAEKWYALYAQHSASPKERALAKLKIAACRYKQGKYQEAIAEAKDVLGRYSELDDEANLLLGKALGETGRPQDALATWSKVRGANDFGAEAGFRIGKYHEEQSDFEKARAYYDTAKTRRVDSDYGVLAVKRLALLDALAARTTGKKAGGDSLTPAEAAFLVAEVNNLNLGEYEKAMDLYQKVYDSFPGTEWAAKALFAKAWISRSVKHDTASAEPVLRKVIAEYPETEYADESRRWLGLPVPKRPKKKPEPEPETTAVKPPAIEQPPPAPRESLSPDTGEIAVTREPEMYPPGMRGPHGPGRFPGRRDMDTGSGATGRGESLAGKVDTLERDEGAERKREEGRARREEGRKIEAEKPVGEQTVPKDTVPAKAQERPAPERPVASLQLEIAHFATDSWQISAADSVRLRADAEALKAHSEVKVTIVGHCDPRASERYNRELGLRRAQAVRDLLVAVGVAADRISVRSDGETRPISTKPDEYWLDRRVEFEYR